MSASVIPFAIYCCKLALMAIILFFVVPMITAMPPLMQKLCQTLIILIAIFAALDAVLADHPTPIRYPSMGPAPPSIIAPERGR